jgi:hypothetical protein
MGPGARHTALDDSWGGWNWKKILGLGESQSVITRIRNILTTGAVGSLLEKGLLKADEMASKQRQAANDFSATFPKKIVRGWARMVKQWEANPSYPNPYVSKEHGKFSFPYQTERSSPFYQHQRYLQLDCNSLRKRPQKQREGRRPLTRSLRRSSCAWVLNLRINSTDSLLV